VSKRPAIHTKATFYAYVKNLRHDQSSNRLRSLLDDVNIHLVMDPDKHGNPILMLDPVIEFAVESKKHGLRMWMFPSVSLFTLTSKMRCGSISLPAGPPGLDGTCAASSLGNELGFVCWGCYSLRNNYTYGSTQLGQLTRMVWLQRQGKRLAPQLQHALDSFNSHQRKVKIKLPTGHPSGKKSATVPINHHYFRLHDCGDFFSKDYYEAWLNVISRDRRCVYWAPTRMWATAQASWFGRRPAHFVLRPSSLMFQAKPPRVSGMDAGSSSADEENLAKTTRDCPAYATSNNGVSCATANRGKGCRLCWLEPRTPVNYAPHGVSDKQTRRNPEQSLDELFEQYQNEAAAVQTNPPARPAHDASSEPYFEAWLGSRGARDEGEWLVWLEKRGITGPEAYEYLQAHAEWWM